MILGVLARMDYSYKRGRCFSMLTNLSLIATMAEYVILPHPLLA